MESNIFKNYRNIYIRNKLPKTRARKTTESRGRERERERTMANFAPRHCQATEIPLLREANPTTTPFYLACKMDKKNGRKKQSFSVDLIFLSIYVNPRTLQNGKLGGRKKGGVYATAKPS